MAFINAVMGESGSGKTSAMRTLPFKETVYIDCDGKGLAWKGWREQYSVANKNYLRSSDTTTIVKMLMKIDKEMPHIKYVVIDTVNGIMVDDEMNRMKDKGYDKWADLAACVYGLIKTALLLRDDLTIIFTAHVQTERDDNGMVWSRIKTNGKKLDKIVLESKFPVVFFAKCVDGQYVFETHCNNSTAKTPLGSFEEDTIPNDMLAAIKKLEEYR